MRKQTDKPTEILPTIISSSVNVIKLQKYLFNDSKMEGMTIN